MVLLYVKRLLVSVKRNREIILSIVSLVPDVKVTSVSSLVRIRSHAFSTGIAVNNELNYVKGNHYFVFVYSGVGYFVYKL